MARPDRPNAQCRRHPRFPTDDCPFCEARIARAEDARSGLWDVDEDVRGAEERYEREIERFFDG